jgi:hypothetical protein
LYQVLTEALEANMKWDFDCWLDEVDVHAIPVQVVGVEGEGVSEFPNLAAAQRLFPELDPYKSSDQFTWALRGEMDGAPALRFETWTAYKFFSE